MKKHIWILFLLPSFAGICIFALLPFTEVVRRSFFTSVTEQFVGVSNYKTVFENQAFQTAAYNTFRFTVVCLPLLLLLSLVVSLFLSGRQYMHAFKTVFLFPMAVPAAAVVLIWKLLFYQGGILNALWKQWGLVPVDFLESDAAFWVLVVSYIWKNMGYSMVLWLAGISEIPLSILEAGKVDGAGAWKSFTGIILPNLKTTAMTIILLSFLNSLKVFREAYLVAGSYPHDSIYLLQHLFNNWFVKLDFDKMAAAGVCIGVVMLVGILLLLGLLGRRGEL